MSGDKIKIDSGDKFSARVERSSMSGDKIIERVAMNLE